MKRPPCTRAQGVDKKNGKLLEEAKALFARHEKEKGTFRKGKGDIHDFRPEK
jgi:hypothetical protein